MSQSNAFTAQMPSTGRKLFTLDEANNALPYVAKVIEDIRSSYRRAVDLQQRLEFPSIDDDPDEVQIEYDHIVQELNRFVDELGRVGVELKDYDMGLIDFPALHEGREIYLCWKSGETTICAWHEVDAGFAGRKDIAVLRHD
jgi:hypothetical protein